MPDPAPPVTQLADAWNADAARIRRTIGKPGLIDRETMRTMSGMDVFAAIHRGELPTPPIGALIDFLAIEYGPGRFVFQGTPRIDHYNPLGTVHGGYAATLLTRASDAPSTRCCRPARATRRSS